MFSGEEFIINFIDGLAFVSESKSIEIKKLNLPFDIFEFKEPAYWNCRIINYKPEEKSIFAEILAYHHDNSEFSSFQETESAFFDQVDLINFRGINTSKLLATANGRNSIKPFISKNKEESEQVQEDNIIENEELIKSRFSDDSLYYPIDIGQIAPKSKRIVRQTCLLEWKALKFDFGSVLINCKVKKLDRRVEARIYNEHLRVEYDAVKNYFAKLFGSKKININLTISLENNEITKVYAQSSEIDKINPTVIEAIRFELIKELPKKKLISPLDKSLFTMEEYFQAAIDPKINAGSFYKNERDLMEDMLKITETKHYKNLRFLAEHHAYQTMKLRFILKPFSFLFLLEGLKAYHLIWETLDTEEATYIWHSEKDIGAIKTTLHHIEAIIHTVKVQGKIAYIQSSRDLYHRIYHDYSLLQDGYIKWKSELENVLY